MRKMVFIPLVYYKNYLPVIPTAAGAVGGGWFLALTFLDRYFLLPKVWPIILLATFLLIGSIHDLANAFRFFWLYFTRPQEQWLSLCQGAAPAGEYVLEQSGLFSEILWFFYQLALIVYIFGMAHLPFAHPRFNATGAMEIAILFILMPLAARVFMYLWRRWRSGNAMLFLPHYPLFTGDTYRARIVFPNLVAGKIQLEISFIVFETAGQVGLVRWEHAQTANAELNAKGVPSVEFDIAVPLGYKGMLSFNSYWCLYAWSMGQGRFRKYACYFHHVPVFNRPSNLKIPKMKGARYQRQMTFWPSSSVKRKVR